MVTFKKSSFPLTHIVENTFYVDTLFKLAEFTTDVEIIIKQKVWAVNGNFQEIKFPVTQCILSYHDTDLKTHFLHFESLETSIDSSQTKCFASYTTKTSSHRNYHKGR